MTIGVWGDSITHGLCDSEALGWVGRIRKVLPTDDDNHIYNFGISGDTSEDLVTRFGIEAKAIKPDRIIFAVGFNDSKFPNGTNEHNVSLASYERNLERLISEGKEYTEEIIIIGATGVDDEYRSARGSRFLNEEIQRFNDVMKRVADKYNLLYIEVFETLDPSIDLADGLHPNAAGYQKLFEVITDKVNFV